MCKHAMTILALAALALAGAGCELSAGTEPTGNGSSRAALVIRPVDGDTLLVRVSGEERYVRLVGGDSPESVRPGVEPECGSQEASDSMKQLAPQGSRVKLTRDPTQEGVDRYGRLLRYAEARGRDVMEAQMRRGWTEVYVYDDSPFERLERYRRASEMAESRGSGVWGSCGGDFHSGS